MKHKNFKSVSIGLLALFLLITQNIFGIGGPQVDPSGAQGVRQKAIDTENHSGIPIYNNGGLDIVITDTGKYFLADDLTSRVVIRDTSGVTLDLNDHCITVTGASEAIRVEATSANQEIMNITIKDGTIFKQGATSPGIRFDFTNAPTYGEITLEGLSVQSAAGGTFASPNNGIHINAYDDTLPVTNTIRGLVIRECIVCGFPFDGINVANVENLLIEGCIIKDNGRNGIELAQSENAYIKCCELTNNGGLAGGADGQAIRLFADGNDTTGFPPAYVNNTVIEDCIITNNAFRGIYLPVNDEGAAGIGSASGLTLKNCDISGNANNGVFLHAIDGTATFSCLAIYDCLIGDNGAHGLSLFAGGTTAGEAAKLHNISIYNTTCSDNTLNGMIVGGGLTGQVTSDSVLNVNVFNSDFLNNASHGIGVVCDNATGEFKNFSFIGCTAQQNTNSGFLVVYNSLANNEVLVENVSFFDCTSIGNTTGSGFVIDAGAANGAGMTLSPLVRNAAFYGCTALRNGSDGISINANNVNSRVSGVIFRKCIANDNIAAGYALRNTGGSNDRIVPAIIRECTAIGNGTGFFSDLNDVSGQRAFAVANHSAHNTTDYSGAIWDAVTFAAGTQPTPAGINYWNNIDR